MSNRQKINQKSDYSTFYARIRASESLRFSPSNTSFILLTKNHRFLFSLDYEIIIQIYWPDTINVY